MSQEDRRTSKRFTVVDLDLFLLESDSQIGNVVNISQGGLLAITDDEMQLNISHSFRIPFNQTVNGQINFDFKGQIAWSNPSTLEAKKFSTGVEFSENPELQVKFIHQMIKVFGSN